MGVAQSDPREGPLLVEKGPYQMRRALTR